MTTKPRTFATVLSDIRGNVPKDQAGLHAALASLDESSRYRAPEQARLSWEQLEEILTDALGIPSEDWHRAIVKIVSGK